jgi:hypothetical protein
MTLERLRTAAAFSGSWLRFSVSRNGAGSARRESIVRFRWPTRPQWEPLPPGENVSPAPDATDRELVDRIREILSLDVSRSCALWNFQEFRYLGQTRELVGRHDKAGYVGARTKPGIAIAALPPWNKIASTVSD